jgi:hypothetical protein
LIAAFSIASMAWGQPAAERPASSKSSTNAIADERGTEKAPLVIKTLTPQKSRQDADREAKESEERRGLEKATLDVSKATLEINKSQLAANVWQTWFNGLLFLTTVIGAGITWRAATAAKDAANYAGKSATPLLMPYVLQHNFDLHPLAQIDQPVVHTSKLLLAFDNYGSTPATVKSVKARLFHVVRDAVPRNEKIDSWEPITYTVIVPGQFRGKDLSTGALDFRQQVSFSPVQLAEILAEADERTVYRRFLMIGHVVYDDVFGYRHTRRFCIKFRMLPRVVRTRRYNGHFHVIDEALHVGLFQVAQGPAEYSTTKVEPIPKHSPETELEPA